ncbi:hypothetical protein ABKN59_003182 [Abortiporus biennis]
MQHKSIAAIRCQSQGSPIAARCQLLRDNSNRNQMPPKSKHRAESCMVAHVLILLTVFWIHFQASLIFQASKPFFVSLSTRTRTPEPLI